MSYIILKTVRANDMKNELTHHGILGMKWGKRQGPPYPLDYSKLSAEEKSQAKAKAIRDGNVKEAEKNRSEFEDNELRQLINRYDLNTRLADINKKDVKTGGQKVDGVIKGLERTAKLAEGSTRVYNAFAKVANAFGENLPIIGEGQGKKKNIADRKTKKQLEEILKNPGEFTTEEYKDAKSAYENISNAESSMNGPDIMTEAKMRDVIINPDNYDSNTVKEAVMRQNNLNTLIRNNMKQQEEAEAAATEKVNMNRAAYPNPMIGDKHRR